MRKPVATHYFANSMQANKARVSSKGIIMKKKGTPDPDEVALIEWCIEVEAFLVAAGATLRQAQEHIEEQAEWFTDQFYNGLTPEEAAKAALN